MTAHSARAPDRQDPWPRMLIFCNPRIIRGPESLCGQRHGTRFASLDRRFPYYCVHTFKDSLFECMRYCAELLCTSLGLSVSLYITESFWGLPPRRAFGGR